MTSPEKSPEQTPAPAQAPAPIKEEKPAENVENTIIEGTQRLPETYPKIPDPEDPFDPADYGGTPYGGPTKVTPKPNDFW